MHPRHLLHPEPRAPASCWVRACARCASGAGALHVSASYDLLVVRYLVVMSDPWRLDDSERWKSMNVDISALGIMNLY
jgi:hypothetical protein